MVTHTVTGNSIDSVYIDSVATGHDKSLTLGKLVERISIIINIGKWKTLEYTRVYHEDNMRDHENVHESDWH